MNDRGTSTISQNSPKTATRVTYINVTPLPPKEKKNVFLNKLYILTIGILLFILTTYTMKNIKLHYKNTL